MRALLGFEDYDQVKLYHNNVAHFSPEVGGYDKHHFAFIRFLKNDEDKGSVLLLPVLPVR